MNGQELSDEAKQILVQYVNGEHTAAGAAWELWNRKLTPLEDPRAGDVIVWAKECGFGIPNPPEEEIADQVRKALAYLKGN